MNFLNVNYTIEIHGIKSKKGILVIKELLEAKWCTFVIRFLLTYICGIVLKYS